MTQVVLRLVFLAAAGFFGATSCGVLRAESESFFESFFESPSKANTYGIVGTMTKAPEPSGRLKVKVVPGSSRDGIVGWLGEALKIKVTTPPEKGRANEAVVKMLAERLGLTTDAVAVVSGHSSASKVVAINHMDNEMLKKSLGEP